MRQTGAGVQAGVQECWRRDVGFLLFLKQRFLIPKSVVVQGGPQELCSAFRQAPLPFGNTGAGNALGSPCHPCLRLELQGPRLPPPHTLTTVQ